MYIYAQIVLQFGKQVMYKFNLFHKIIKSTFLKSGAKIIIKFTFFYKRICIINLYPDFFSTF
jgi:hypothetical protein